MSKALPAALARLHELAGPDLDLTNRIIMERLDSQVEMIPQLGTHLIQSGGKRLRPLLTLVAARMFGYSGERHALLAAVVEFIHTATLLHDDVVDHSSTRRGRATANSMWGDKAPVLVGDFLFSRAFQMMVEHGDLRVLKIVADACAVISEGEVLQLVVSHRLDTTEEQYLKVVSGKTATLFAAATEIGAVINEVDDAIRQRLAEYGLLLGMAYQVVDDALDYDAEQETLGKTVGDDFQEGKITLPLIHAFRHGSEEERGFWLRCIEGRDYPEGALQRAIALVRERGSVRYALERAETFAQQAVRALGDLPPSPGREALIGVAEFTIRRRY
ncbi:MAG: polyprenyl synthetase family protein [Magnetococcales bacterium]|nr:polyprenyl synthetase family protein [Magnetococcales bacterium]